eukprot:360774-Chlamydomonas_euryale.AAC.1
MRCGAHPWEARAAARAGDAPAPAALSLGARSTMCRRPVGGSPRAPLTALPTTDSVSTAWLPRVRAASADASSGRSAAPLLMSARRTSRTCACAAGSQRHAHACEAAAGVGRARCVLRG